MALTKSGIAGLVPYYDGANARFTVEDDVLFGFGTDGDIVLVNRSTTLAANTAVTNALLGTPVTPALAADSLILSNRTADGDFLLAANLGGNSQAWVWVDASAGTMRLYGAGTAAVEVASTYAQVLDDILLGVGTGNTARFSYDTTDANANELLLQMPAGGATDVPVLAVGQSIESVDLGLFNGIVDPTVALFGVGAVATGTGVRFYKARGTVTAPTVCTTGDDLMTLRGYGCVAAGEYVQGAEIRFDIAGTIATTRGPGTITFLTATDAAPSVLTQAMIISAAQLVTLTAGRCTGDFYLNLTLTAGADGVGASGEQLTSGGAAAECTWAAAGSLLRYKDIAGLADPQDALARFLGANVYRFHYKEKMGTGDTKSEYRGVVSEEAPWAMHYDGRIINPVNTLGDTILAFQAMQQEIDGLKEELAHKRAN